MATICKVCGGMAKPGATTCAYCGAELVASRSVNQSELACEQSESCDKTVSNLRLFSSSCWRSHWATKRAQADRIGIILTNTKKLSNSKEFFASVEKYVQFKSSKGIEYCLLDLKDQAVLSGVEDDCQSIIDLLDEVYSEAVPDYLLIVGDSSVIPSMVWDNLSGDSDSCVVSDLPYITFDVDSPWDGKEYDFEYITQVGRVPASAQTGFKHAVKYFENTMNFLPYNSVNAFCCGAKVWEQTTDNVFAKVCPDAITSPEYTTNALTARNNGLRLFDCLSAGYNLLCYNLHGSEATHKWYGQLGSSYPEAFEKEILTGRKSGYAIMVEACYGARPDKGQDSIVVHALSNNCVGFVGSTKIAYGCGNGSMVCADVIAKEFTERVSSGATFGGAFLSALTELCRSGNLDETEIKTLAEFNLYGDPSCTLVNNCYSGKAVITKSKAGKPQAKTNVKKAVKLMSCSDKPGKKMSGGISLMSFSPKEQQEIKKMAFTVKEKGKGYILTKYSSMKDVEPEVFKDVNSGSYRAVYTKQSGEVNTIIKLMLDKNGQIEKEYLSK